MFFSPYLFLLVNKHPHQPISLSSFCFWWMQASKVGSGCLHRPPLPPPQSSLSFHSSCSHPLPYLSAAHPSSPLPLQYTHIALPSQSHGPSVSCTHSCIHTFSFSCSLLQSILGFILLPITIILEWLSCKISSNSKVPSRLH